MSGGGSGGAGAGADDASRLAALERRVARLEDVAAIERVKAVYAQACDTDYDVDLFLSIFTEDGVWQSNAFGTFSGHDGLTTFMRDADWGTIRFVHHSMIPQWIDVAEDGQSARGFWYLVEFASRPGPPDDRADRAVVIAGTYDDEFVKVGGEWKIKRCLADFAFNSDWDKGWVEQRYR